MKINSIGHLAAFALFAGLLLPAFATTSKSVDFSSAMPFLELRPDLSAYHSADSMEADNSRWEIMVAANPSPRPATRILAAEEPADAALRLFPKRARPGIAQVASSDPDVVAEPAQAYGRHAFRVVIPAGRTVSLALRLTNTDANPPIAAWNEAALASHNRQLAVYFAAVAGLIAAALAITTGLAVMSGNAPPVWAAFTLLGLFLSRLAAAGVFDSIGSANIGGPYGLSAMLAGLALAAGIRFTDSIAPLDELVSGGSVWAVRAALGVVVVSFLAVIGVPGAMLVSEALVVGVVAILSGYLVNRGRKGVQAARMASPAAAAFALVAAAGAATALGAFVPNPAMPGVIGGFAAAGAVLLSLAVAAEEGMGLDSAPRSQPERFDPPWDAIAASHQGVFDFDIGADRVCLSPEAIILCGLDENADEFPHQDWVGRIHPDDRNVYLRAMEDFHAQAGTAFRIEFRLERLEDRWLELRATMIPATKGMRCLGLLADVSARVQSEVPRDELRGFPGRPELLVALRSEESAVVALVDIDRFKSVHASLGDEGGDRVLVAFARRLARAFGDSSPVFRVGGDSFAIVTDCDELHIEGIRANFVGLMKRPVEVDGRDVHLSASVGLARLQGSPEETLKRATDALSDAKRSGGGSWRWHDAATAPIPDSVALEAALRDALRNGEMETHFQPIMRLKDFSLVGFEALLRWNHPAKGLLEPAEFIGHAEKSGLIVELGKFALERAVQELVRWQRYFPLDPPLLVSANLSRRQLESGDFERALEALLKNTIIARGTLIVELTESAATSVPDASGRFARLKAAGARLALDDFGTGLSTLGQLKNLPFDVLKIDKSFLAPGSADSEKSSRTVLRSIVELAHGLELTVVAEGVENAIDASMLNDIGCEMAQGYYFSPPLPASDVLAFIARHHAGAGT